MAPTRLGVDVGGTFTDLAAFDESSPLFGALPEFDSMAVATLLTELAASGEAGPIDEVTSPDDNLQAVFQYLVKQ